MTVPSLGVPAGLPDFGSPLSGGPAPAYLTFAEDAAAVLWPSGLDVATGPDGRPALRLHLLRPVLPTAGPDAGYGVLDLTLTARWDGEAALTAFRADRSGLTVAQPQCSGGGLLVDWNLNTSVAGPTTSVVALGPDGPSGSRARVPLSLDEADRLRSALLSDALALRITALTEIRGVSPRSPVSVSFDPAELLPALEQFATNGTISWSALATWIADGQAPLQLSDTTAALGRPIAEAVADRIRSRFGLPALPAAYAVKDPFTLGSERPGPGRFTWDLSVPTVASRPVTLAVDPLATALAGLAAADLAALIVEGAMPPAVAAASGTRTVRLVADLPFPRPGVLDIGATLTAPPRLPWRPEAAVAQVSFTAPEDAAQAELILAPDEPLEFGMAGYAVLQQGPQLIQLTAQSVACTGSWQSVTESLFPVVFLPFSAGPALLALADLRVTAVATHPDHGSLEVEALLTASNPAAAPALPTGSTGLAITVTATPHDGSPTVTLGPYGVVPGRLDLVSFPTYGPHRIPVSGPFDGPAPPALVAVDLCAEGQESAPTTLALTPQNPHRSWWYAATDPFHGGYRWRPHGDPPAAWSPVIPPTEPLLIPLPDPTRM